MRSVVVVVVVPQPLINRWACLLLCLGLLAAHASAYPSRAREEADNFAQLQSKTTLSTAPRPTEGSDARDTSATFEFSVGEALKRLSFEPEELEDNSRNSRLHQLAAFRTVLERALRAQRFEDVLSSSDELNYNYNDDDDDDDDVDDLLFNVNRNSNNDDDDDDDSNNKNNFGRSRSQSGDPFRDVRIPGPGMPSARLGEADHTGVEARPDSNYDMDGERGFPYNGGSFNLPDADRRGDRSQGRLSVDADIGGGGGGGGGGYVGQDGIPSAGNDNVDEELEVIDESPYSARRPISVGGVDDNGDLFQSRFKELNADDPYRTDMRAPDEAADAAAGINCPSQSMSEYFTARFGSVGMLLVVLALLYMCAVAVFVHYQWFSALKNPGDKELL